MRIKVLTRFLVYNESYTHVSLNIVIITSYYAEFNYILHNNYSILLLGNSYT